MSLEGSSVGRFESIDHEVDLPCKVFLHAASWTPRHWHDDMELLLVIEGGLRIVFDSTEEILSEGDTSSPPSGFA